MMMTMMMMIIIITIITTYYYLLGHFFIILQICQVPQKLVFLYHLRKVLTDPLSAIGEVTGRSSVLLVRVCHSLINYTQPKILSSL